MAAVVAVAAACLACASAAVAVDLGVQDDRVFLGPPVTSDAATLDAASGLRAAQDLGARTVKLLVRWAPAERVAGHPPDLERYDRAVELVLRHGLRVQLTIGGPAPAWATADGRVSAHRPDPRAFGRFAGQVAERFRGRVSRYAIWNEPNWHGALAPARSAPRLYRSLYRAAWTALRRADPAARVLFGELAPIGRPEAATPPLRFLRGVTCSDRHWRPARHCRPLRAHGFAHHPYTLRWPPAFPGAGPDDVTTGSLHRLSCALRRLGRQGALRTPNGQPMPLFLTEWGWHARSRLIPEPLRSHFIADGLELVARRPDVRELVWYQIAGIAPTATGWDTGLLDADGTQRPAYEALRRALIRQR